MKTGLGTVRVSREIGAPLAKVWHHWTDPEARQRWEAGEGSGMTYDAFDTRPGGVEPPGVGATEGSGMCGQSTFPPGLRNIDRCPGWRVPSNLRS